MESSSTSSAHSYSFSHHRSTSCLYDILAPPGMRQDFTGKLHSLLPPKFSFWPTNLLYYDAEFVRGYDCYQIMLRVNNFFLQSRELHSLWKRIRRVRPESSAPGSWFLLHNNAPVRRAVAVQEFLARKQVCVLDHPPYSPNLSPCYYFLFPKLKLPLKWHLFEDVQDIQGAVPSSLRAIPQGDVQRSFQSLLDRTTRCIDAEGMYSE